MKEALKYSDKAKAEKQTAKDQQDAIDMMSAMILTNGHRDAMNGRSVLFYDIVANPNFQAKNMIQRFGSVMQGKISLDEQTGEVIDLNIRSLKDLKIAGGVVASLHKGFWLHIHSTPQPGGVWLNDLNDAVYHPTLCWNPARISKSAGRFLRKITELNKGLMDRARKHYSTQFHVTTPEIRSKALPTAI
jgi:hypothetical protein